MDKILKYDKLFTVAHTNIILLLLVYYFALFFGGRPDEVTLLKILPLFVTYLINIILNQIKYYNSPTIFFLSRGIYLALTATFSLYTLHSNPYGSILAISCYFFIVLEIAITAKQHSKASQVFIVLSCMIPVLFANILMFFLSDNLTRYSTDIAVIFIFVVCLLYYIIKSVSSLIQDLEDGIKIQTKLYNDTKQANETLLVTQQKFKQANEQLGRQKLDLEQAYKNINRVNSEIYIQNELISYISSALEIGELMEVVTDSIIGAKGVDTCALILINPVDHKVITNIKSTSGKVVEEKLHNFALEGKFLPYFEAGDVIVDGNVDVEKYPFHTHQNGSLLLMPLIMNDKGYGLLIAGQKQRDMFNDNVSFFKSITNQINIAVTNANLYAKMENLAIRDGLTQVYNRAYLTKKLMDLATYAEQSRTPISLALFDIDKFKKVNDTYGHMFGDEAIKAVCNVAQEVAEEHNGLVGRFGGEEFVVILPGHGIEAATKIITDMHEKIHNNAIYFGDEKVYIYISIGLTCYPDTCRNPNDLLNRADWSCYYSKQHGRARLTIDNDEIRKEINM